MATLRRTPDMELGTKEAALFRIGEYQKLLSNTAESDSHRLYLARIRALRAKWGIDTPANPGYDSGLLASKADIEEYVCRGQAVGAY